MIVIDNLLRERQAQGQAIRVGLIGAGFMAKGIVNQILNSVPGMSLVAVSNRNPDRARDIYREAGSESAEVVTSAGAMEDRIRAGQHSAVDNAHWLCESDAIDCLIDATGAVEFGLDVTLKAIACGKHMVTMNAELDATVGPVLHRRAREAGVILTACDGDQPGVQMNLFRFVQGLGLQPLVCGNVKGLQDEHRNPTTQAGFAAKWGQNPYMVTSFADGTKISFEQAIVANATGMSIAERGMVGMDHDGHVDELTQRYDLEQLKSLGGVVDYVVGAKPGPGVYVIASHDDPKQRHYLNLYKLGEGPLYSFYTPYHLCHFEVPNSVARAVLLGDAVMRPLDAAPKVEVVATAKVDLAPGDTIDALGGYKSYGQCETYEVTRAQRLLPMGLAEDCKLVRPVKADTVITYDDVEIPTGRQIDKVRAEQEAMYA